MGRRLSRLGCHGAYCSRRFDHVLWSGRFRRCVATEPLLMVPSPCLGFVPVPRRRVRDEPLSPLSAFCALCGLHRRVARRVCLTQLFIPFTNALSRVCAEDFRKVRIFSDQRAQFGKVAATHVFPVVRMLYALVTLFLAISRARPSACVRARFRRTACPAPRVWNLLGTPQTEYRRNLTIYLLRGHFFMFSCFIGSMSALNCS